MRSGKERMNQEKNAEKLNKGDRLVFELPKALIGWYPFRQGNAMLITDENLCDHDRAYREVLEETGLNPVLCSDPLGEGNVSGQYDYIVAVGKLEKCREPEKLLSALKEQLKPKGILLLGTDNRLAARYFCGDRDAFTGRSFDGVENYIRINEADRENLSGRSYSKKEIVDFLKTAGFSKFNSFSVFPALAEPQQFYAEDYLPNEAMESRADTYYSNPETIFLEETRLYATLIENGLFHVMANACLFECTKDGELSDALHVTTSVERGKEDAIATIIGRDKKVRKRPLYNDGGRKIKTLLANQQDLKNHGVNVVEGCIEGQEYVMDFITGESVAMYLKRLANDNYDQFVTELERFYQEILKSSEPADYRTLDWEKLSPNYMHMKSDDPNRFWWRDLYERDPDRVGVILKKGYIDMASINCFLVDNEFVFYDQEFVMENIPAKTILWRSIDFVYWGNISLQYKHPKEELLKHFGIDAIDENKWSAPVMNWISNLRNWNELQAYHGRHRADLGVISSNRQRMNYSAEEYERYFRDIFENTDRKKLYLFGSGNFTRKFLSEFGKECKIEGILDNNPSKWGQEMNDIRIMDPEVLVNLSPDSYKVIICIKNYVPVLMQLRSLGVSDYGIYDWNLSYRTKRIIPAAVNEQNDKPKKYHIGYVAGVFDLFHIGHVNLLRNAKEQCDHLIVGVVSDEQVKNSKGTTPYMCFEDRLEIVRACRYVDEAVEVPPEFSNTEEAFRRYRFDAQFSGSDYENDPVWAAKKEFLQKHGADLVFFPYTQSTSSTKLKAEIKKDSEA